MKNEKRSFLGGKSTHKMYNAQFNCTGIIMLVRLRGALMYKRVRKFLLTLIAMFALLTANAANTYSTETVDGITWYYSVVNGVASLGYRSGLYDPPPHGRAISQDTEGTVTIPATLGGRPVKAMESGAFEECTKLSSIAMPNGVTNIASSAFCNCSSLTDIAMPESLITIGDKAFLRCSSLTDIMIPEAVTKIGYAAFLGCSSLTDIMILGAVTKIEYAAFQGCSSLTNIMMPKSVTNIDDSAFSNCGSLIDITIPEGVTNIGNSAFSNCGSLTNVVIPSLVKKVGDHTFDGCSNLVSVTMPKGITNIAQRAFGSCPNLTSVVIPNGVIASRYCFADSSKIANVKIIQNPQNMCVDLPLFVIFPAAYTTVTNVVFDEDVSRIGAHTFSNCLSLTRLTIPNGITSIGNGAFYGCSKLKSLTIPQAVCSSSMATMCMDIYQSITNIVIADGVTKISEGCFRGCESLESITIPASVTSIRAKAFENCSSLKTVRFLGEAPDVNDDIYHGTLRTLVTYVPQGSKGWNGGVADELPEVWPVGDATARAIAYWDGPDENVTAAPVIVPPGGTLFTNECEVSISCATEGAKIYYTTNGSTPRASARYAYSGPFSIDGTTTIKAVAMVEGRENSDYVTAVLNKVEAFTLPLALGTPIGVDVTTSEGFEWFPAGDYASPTYGLAARSGQIPAESETWLEAVVNGAGTFTFWWRVSCEKDPDGTCSWDHLSCDVDEEHFASIDGISKWERRDIVFEEAKDHNIRWTFMKDDFDEDEVDYEDCAWLAGFSWKPTAVQVPSSITGGKPVIVEKVWSERYPLFDAMYGLDFAAAVTSTTGKVSMDGKALSVWNDYVIGTDPTDIDDQLLAHIAFRGNVPVISWTPNLNTNCEVRTYKVFGKTNLTDSAWVYPMNRSHRFFKVKVEMP